MATRLEMAIRREMGFWASLLIAGAILFCVCCLAGDGADSKKVSPADLPVVDVAAEVAGAVGGDGGRELGDSVVSVEGDGGRELGDSVVSVGRDGGRELGNSVVSVGGDGGRESGDSVVSSSTGDPLRSWGLLGGQAAVKAVALKHVVARGEEFERGNSKQIVAENGVEVDAAFTNSTHGDEEGVVPVPAADADRRIGKRMIVPAGRRGRSLRTSQRSPYPCSLPPGACGPEKSCCGNACVSVNSNPNHCGRCGHMCSLKRTCCSGKCRRLTTDERNCGQCGARCASGVKCLLGLCGY